MNINPLEKIDKTGYLVIGHWSGKESKHIPPSSILYIEKADEWEMPPNKMLDELGNVIYKPGAAGHLSFYANKKDNEDNDDMNLLTESDMEL